MKNVRWIKEQVDINVKPVALKRNEYREEICHLYLRNGRYLEWIRSLARKIYQKMKFIKN